MADLFGVIAGFRAKWASHAECWGEKDTPKLLDSLPADLTKEKKLITKSSQTDCYKDASASSKCDKKQQRRQTSKSSLAATETEEPPSVTTSAEVAEPDIPVPVRPAAAAPEPEVPADAEPEVPKSARDLISEIDFLGDLSPEQRAEFVSLKEQIAELEFAVARPDE